VAARPPRIIAPQVDPGPLPPEAGPGTPQEWPLTEFAGLIDNPWLADEQAIRDMDSYGEDFHDFFL